jgi:hypothetical protein
MREGRLPELDRDPGEPAPCPDDAAGPHRAGISFRGTHGYIEPRRGRRLRLSCPDGADERILIERADRGILHVHVAARGRVEDPVQMVAVAVPQRGDEHAMRDERVEISHALVESPISFDVEGRVSRKDLDSVEVGRKRRWPGHPVPAERVEECRVAEAGMVDLDDGIFAQAAGEGDEVLDRISLDDAVVRRAPAILVGSNVHRIGAEVYRVHRDLIARNRCHDVG